jgi:hypothetical protein
MAKHSVNSTTAYVSPQRLLNSLLNPISSPCIKEALKEARLQRWLLDDGLAFQGRLLFGDNNAKEGTSSATALSQQSLDLPSAEERKIGAAARRIMSLEGQSE